MEERKFLEYQEVNLLVTLKDGSQFEVSAVMTGVEIKKRKSETISLDTIDTYRYWFRFDSRGEPKMIRGDTFLPVKVSINFERIIERR